jgi:hypothetical protein
MDAIHTVKSIVGHALRPVHAGSNALISYDARLSAALSVHLESPAFTPLGAIPLTYSAEGENLSPPLNWSGPPAATNELLLICEDPDAPKTRPFIHWIAYGISPDRDHLPEGVPNMDPLASMPDVRQAPNSMGQIGYFGPLPPTGHGVHHYHFQLFALDEPTRFNFCPNRDDLIAAMSGHVLATGELVGTYEIK